MSYSIRTERLLMREPRLRDAGPLARVVNDPDMTRMTGTWPYPVTADYARFRLRQSMRLDPRSDLLLILVHARAVIGTLGLNRRRGRAFEVGYWIGRDWWGRGLATEATRAACGFAFRRLRAERIEAGAYLDNPASHRVLAKVGFRPVGAPVPYWSVARGEAAPSQEYALTREGWPQPEERPR